MVTEKEKKAEKNKTVVNACSSTSQSHMTLSKEITKHPIFCGQADESEEFELEWSHQVQFAVFQ